MSWIDRLPAHTSIRSIPAPRVRSRAAHHSASDRDTTAYGGEHRQFEGDILGQQPDGNNDYYEGPKTGRGAIGVSER